MQKTILMGLMVLPFNLYVYSLVFPVADNMLSASPDLAIANFRPSPNHDPMWGMLASRDEQPGDCLRSGECKL